jgi:putative membrane-bound dehydrogenase-like protein
MTAEVARRTGMPVERLAISATHTHTAPMLAGVAPTLFGLPIPPDHQAHIDRYTRELTDKLTEVAKAALADRKPANLSWGVGSVGFAINRRTKGGPVDHDLPVLAIRDSDGKLRAVVVGYACHCVTLANNKIGGDWAGCARDAIQDKHPGTIALITIGCGADQNPDTRGKDDNLEPAEVQGRAIAGEVDRLLGQFLAPVRGPIAASARNVNLDFEVPSRAQWVEKAKKTDAIGYHAKVNLARLDKGEPLTSAIDYPVQTWAFGDDLAMAFLPGEVVVDYGLRLKRELDGRRLWVTAYSNDSPCYIPSERVLREGGYEGGGAMVYYDKPGPLQPGLEDKIVGAVKESLGKKFAAPFDPNKVKVPALSPQQSRAKIQVRDGLTVELVAAEPLVQSPVAIAFGPDGRLWVAEMVDYPSGVRGDFQPGGRISVLSDRDEAGRYHTSTVFLNNIPFPTGVTPWRNGVLVCAAPDILYAEDTKGTGKADVVKKLYSGFGTENYQARVNSLEYGLDGWVYGSCGLFGGTIKSFSGVELKLGNRDFRIKPDTGEIEPATGRTQHGRVRNDWGDWFGCDNSNLGYHYPLPDHYIRRNPHAAPTAILKTVSEEPDPNRVFPATKDLQMFALSGPPGRATAACGIGVYRDDLLGRDYQGNLFTCEPVNLLVHRQVLTPSGSSFAGHRASEEKDREFLASTDPWFRPVQMRTGPDGCIYIVDMYRYVIEHPRWIPPGELAKVDVRAGSTLGRIYRVRPTNRDPWPISRLDHMSAIDLARAIDTPNGPVRDLATEMLAWRMDKRAVKALELLAADFRPETHLYALVALDALKSLTVEQVRLAIADYSPHLRRHGVRLAAPFMKDLAGDLLKLASDIDGQVRLQLALTLGDLNRPQSGAVLADFKGTDRFLEGATLSSLNARNLLAYLKRAIDTFDSAPLAMIRGALSTAVGLGDQDSIGFALKRGLALPGVTPAALEMRYRILADLLDAHSRAHKPIEPALDDEGKRLLADGLRNARREVATTSAALPVRLAALSALGFSAADQGADIELLPKLLAPREPPEIQAAAADALARIADPSVPKLLLAAWPDAAPALQAHILDLLLARTDGAAAVLDAVERDAIPARFIDAPRRQRLLTHRDSSTRATAARLFESSSHSDRAKVLKEFESVASLAGDFERGKTVFANRCSTCHRLNDIGHQVGPDLGQLANKSPAYLLQEILDPNRQVDSRYVEYAATTKSGKVIRGLIAAETATSVTLRAADAKDDTLLRSEIDTLESSGRSLMPEGFEKDLSRQDLADVIAYVGGGRKS